MSETHYLVFLQQFLVDKIFLSCILFKPFDIIQSRNHHHPLNTVSESAVSATIKIYLSPMQYICTCSAGYNGTWIYFSFYFCLLNVECSSMQQIHGFQHPTHVHGSLSNSKDSVTKHIQNVQNRIKVLL